MEIAQAHLEYWLRQYYFDTELDIGCSGVESFSFSELRELLGLTMEDLDRVTFRDSRTTGDPELRRAIAGRWGDGDAERVMATNGSSEAIYLIMHALLAPGDEVVVLDPAYQPLFSIAESIGCRMRRWRLRFEDGFRPDLEEAKSLVGPRTRMIIVNFPHNPTGASLTEEEQDELIGLAADAGAYLVWDAAFAEITYGRQPLPNPIGRYDRTIALGTLSKAYGLPGLRVGWCLASPEVMDRLIHLRDYTTLHLSPLVELIATRAIEKAGLLLDLRFAQARRNLEFLNEWAEAHRDSVGLVPPQGGVCVFPRLEGIADIEDFCRRLAEQHGVLLVPGTSFERPQHVRLGFGCATADLRQGLQRLSDLLSTYPRAKRHTPHAARIPVS
jgi:capreomycidine synthase